MYTNEEKVACLKRELTMRHRVYPGLVARGKMTDVEAQREIALMQEIMQDYAANDQGELFAEGV